MFEIIFTYQGSSQIARFLKELSITTDINIDREEINIVGSYKGNDILENRLKISTTNKIVAKSIVINMLGLNFEEQTQLYIA